MVAGGGELLGSRDLDERFWEHFAQQVGAWCATQLMSLAAW